MGKARRKGAQKKKSNYQNGFGESAPQWWPLLQDQQSHPNVPLSYFIRAVDPDGVDAVTYALLNGPPGVQLNPNSGQLTWTPNPQQMGSWPITVQATEQGAGLSTLGTFRVNVVNLAPVIAPIPQPLQAKVNQQFTYNVNATDPEGDLPLTFAVLNGPGTFPGGANPYTFTPKTQGGCSVTIQVSDCLGAASTALMTIQATN